MKIRYWINKIISWFRGYEYFVGIDHAYGADYSCKLLFKRHRDGTMELVKEETESDEIDFPEDMPSSRKLLRKVRKLASESDKLLDGDSV